MSRVHDRLRLMHARVLHHSMLEDRSHSTSIVAAGAKAQQRGLSGSAASALRVVRVQALIQLLGKRSLDGRPCSHYFTAMVVMKQVIWADTVFRTV